ncbi:Hypothetical Protein FCC1311_032932 [Hondaea fermentalgiana]|uniref:C2H2-type domain-containing protein n=1 Tax=Hondaea fermentalgiana TaxID=2315210 RepID=A0A2R5G7V1_9STRA|nr:Hypothetical Protein FCC1311_032932 [Hondaea fermentalgiana]|eukprot:GBG27070.1 Hypothetical Protein FCC1311_032932 [Hondaea fermentalgiana]
MRENVCWVCVRDFSGKTALAEHERGREHLELLFKQALGEDCDRRDARRTQLRAKIAAVQDGLQRDVAIRSRVGPLWTVEQFGGGHNDATTRGSAEQAPDHPETTREDEVRDEDENLTFCRCILDWRVGPCQTCVDAAKKGPPNAADLRRRIFKNMYQAQAVDQEAARRRNALQRGLTSAYLSEIEYDPRAEAEARARALKEMSTFQRILRKAHYMLRRRLSVPDDFRRARSPLQESAVRYKSFKRVHVLGHEIQHPRLTIEQAIDQYAPALIPDAASEAVSRARLQIRRKTARFVPGVESDETIMESSPLIASTKRRPVITRGDIFEERVANLHASLRERIKRNSMLHQVAQLGARSPANGRPV